MALDLRRAYPARPRIWWSAIAALAVLLALLTVAVAAEWALLIDLDDAVAEWAHDLSSGHQQWIDFWVLIHDISSPWVLRPLIVVIGIALLIRRQFRIAAWVLVAAVVGQLIALYAKEVVDRSRPSWADPLLELSSPSYPSGHALGAGLFVTVMILLTIVATARGPVRYLLLTLWSAIGFLIGIDRILLGVHYLSDVIAGGLLGSLLVLVPWVLIMGTVVNGILPSVTETGTGSRRLAVVFNPVKVGDEAVFREQVVQAAAASGWHTPMFFETTIDDPGTSMAHQALESGVDMVLVAGGDGTVRVVCAELARTGVAIGVVPLGTGNLLARNLGIPLHTGDAIDVAFNGQDRAVDVATFESADGGDDEPVYGDTCFMVMAGLGLDAAIMTGAPDELKARMGWFAYVVSALKQLRFPAVKVEISVDDGPFEKYRSRTVVVGNVGQLQAGIPLLPDARIDDGMLDVVVIAPPRALTWLRLVVRVLTRRRRTDEKLARLTGRKVVVRAERPTPQQLDGDPIGEGSEFTAEVQPGVLLIRVPS